MGDRGTLPMNALQHRNSYSAGTQDQRYGAYQVSYSSAAYRPPNRRSATSLEMPWPVYAMDWCKWPNHDNQRWGKIVVGSFCDDSSNRLHVLEAKKTLGNSSFDAPPGDGDLVKAAETEASLPYPITKCMWEPYRTDKHGADLIATTGDYLRLFQVIGSDRGQGIIRQKALLGNTKSDYPAPLTSFDWSSVDPTLIVTASVDTTCTVWDLNTQQAKTQLIAHDKEVFDVAFTAASVDIFASVGADGSVRLFDLRALEHSTIIYEAPANRSASAVPTPRSSSSSPGSTTTFSSSPLLRLSACQRDANLLATFHLDSNLINILDIRSPGSPVLELDAHAASVNAVQWAPGSRNTLASAGDDSQVLVWDLQTPAEVTGGINKLREPSLAWTAESEVNNLSWNGTGDWIAAAYGRVVQGLKV